MKSFFYIFFSFSGRINRTTFLLTFLLPTVFYIALLINVPAYWDPLAHEIIFVGALSVCWWCSFVIQVKRLHDLGSSAWWCLMTAVPLLGLFYL